MRKYCKVCGKPFETEIPQKDTCSQDCYTESVSDPSDAFFDEKENAIDN